MTNITINTKNRTIEMRSKKFADAASRFGTEAYIKLQEARKDYPSYRVVNKFTRNKSADKNKGLSYTYMERYIKAHDDEKGSNMADFKTLRGTSNEAKECGAVSESYDVIKKWFYDTYPAFAEFQKLREKILNKYAENNEAA